MPWFNLGGSRVLLSETQAKEAKAMAKGFGKTCPRCGQAATVKETRKTEGAVVLSCGCKFGKAALALAGIAEPGLKTAEVGEQETITSADVGSVEAVLGKPA